MASGTTTVAGGVIPFVDVAPVNYSSDKQTLKAVDGSLSNLGIVGFQPFKDDPSTQARYARYMALLKQGVKGIIILSFDCFRLIVDHLTLFG